MDAQLKAQLRETIKVATVTGADAAGNSSYAAAVSRSARVVNEQKTIEGGDGSELKTAIVIITEGEIALSDRVWLPGVDAADATAARIPQFSERAIDERGNLDFYRTRL